MIGCGTIIVSETEACNAILEKSDRVTLSVQDTEHTRQLVGETLIMIEAVCRGGV
jgi:phosphoglycerate dehydrogenase-like enzyme